MLNEFSIEYKAHIELIKTSLAELLVLHGVIAEQMKKDVDTMSPQEVESLTKDLNIYRHLERGLDKMGFSSEDFILLMMQHSLERHKDETEAVN